MTKESTAIQPTREEDFPEWYQQVIRAANLAESSPVRGSMVIKPWGYGIWERIQQQLDERIKALGHENAYFPLFIPLSFLQKEASHVEGFAKECAVVTHHRLEERDGKLIPVGELEEPLIVRPTSETIIGDAFSRWVESWRDLPLKINQWANVVRWEMRPRLFLRTTEFLWQEGHTVHATAEEAVDEARMMLDTYREFMENVLAIPVVVGEKSAGERFPGAVATYTLEAMMQDRKALQAGTSHYLGQNFAKSSGIRFTNREGVLEYGYTTSWGVTTRMIGGLLMVHGDDDGARLPPRIAPKQVVIIPIIPKSEVETDVREYAELVAQRIRSVNFHGQPISVWIDDRDRRGGEKSWEWIKKGVPLRIEVGPRDIESSSVSISRRDQPHRSKKQVPVEEVGKEAGRLLQEIQDHYYEQARAFRDAHMERGIRTFAELREYFTPRNADKPEIHGGFALGKWCEEPATEELLKELKISIRCLPLHQSGTEGRCLVTGQKATRDAIFAKSY